MSDQLNAGDVVAELRSIHSETLTRAVDALSNELAHLRVLACTQKDEIAYLKSLLPKSD